MCGRTRCGGRSEDARRELGAMRAAAAFGRPALPSRTRLTPLRCLLRAVVRADECRTRGASPSDASPGRC